MKGITRSIKDGKKRCSSCKTWKPVDDFPLNKTALNGIRSECRVCRRQNRLGEDCRSRGITTEDYYRLYEAQSGLCAICKKPETSKIKGITRRLAIDHSHVTGNVRGLLCSYCNRSLGFINESFEWLQNATEYLRNTS